MKIISTNIGKPTSFEWKGETEQTGIFKFPVQEPLFLTSTDVKGDTVVNRLDHAGIHKACYLFSYEYYDYWKKLYPELAWDYGMFGENLTVDSLDESKIRVGNIYKVGEALVKVSQPREPCYKLGIRFNNQNILKQFVDHKHPGTYLQILKEGVVKSGDTFTLVEESLNSLTIQQFYTLLYERVKNQNILQLLMTNPAVPQYKKDDLKKYISN